jgi:hypothetical protein
MNPQGWRLAGRFRPARLMTSPAEKQKPLSTNRILVQKQIRRRHKKMLRA